MRTVLKIFLAILVSFPVLSLGLSISQSGDDKIYGDVLLSPGSNEVEIKPGGSETSSIFITNRTGQNLDFSVSVEDFTSGTRDDELIKFLGNNYGPYSLRDYIHSDVYDLSLSHGERAEVGIRIDLPDNVLPGGRYAAVFFSFSDDKNRNTSGADIKNRLGSLVFVKVSGPVNEEGSLSGLSLGSKSVFLGRPPTFLVSYKNDGNIYLNPYGGLEARSFMGNKVSELPIDPFFVLPGSTRIIEKEYGGLMWPGKNTVTIRLNRGYGDVIDTQDVSFWYLSYAHIAGFFIFIIILLIVLKLVMKSKK